MCQVTDVREVTERYRALVDERLPGRIEGLYLVGSVALDDYRAGQSDIDFVAVASEAFVSEELDLLERVHRRLRSDIPKPWFDGIYVTWSELGRNPMDLKVAPFTHEGRFERGRGFEANPSTWLTLRNHPLSLRGPDAPRVWYDLAAIRRWNVDNLNSYWRGMANRVRNPVYGAALITGDRAVNWAIGWCVPGVARLNYTITTGDVISKSGACRYALDCFPERWHMVVREALALRNGERPAPRGRVAQRRDVLGFMEAVIDGANDQLGTATT